LEFLLKNPASGGIPAIAKIVKLKTNANKLFFEPIDPKFIIYLGIVL
jgi:hypothetical protein